MNCELGTSCKLAPAGADKNKKTLIFEIVNNKAKKKNKDYPNGNMADAHAEIGVMQQFSDLGNTKGKHMDLTVKGQEVCDYCKSDIKSMAKSMELESITIHEVETNKTTTLSKDDFK